jgi:hypothetical protein
MMFADFDQGSTTVFHYIVGKISQDQVSGIAKHGASLIEDQRDVIQLLVRLPHMNSSTINKQGGP